MFILESSMPSTSFNNPSIARGHVCGTAPMMLGTFREGSLVKSGIAAGFRSQLGGTAVFLANLKAGLGGGRRASGVHTGQYPETISNRAGVTAFVDSP